MCLNEFGFVCLVLVPTLCAGKPYIPMFRVLQLFVASETKIPSSFENLTAVPQVSEVLSIYVQYSKKSGKQ
jgi:hypothetical protein